MTCRECGAVVEALLVLPAEVDPLVSAMLGRDVAMPRACCDACAFRAGWQRGGRTS